MKSVYSLVAMCVIVQLLLPVTPACAAAQETPGLDDREEIVSELPASEAGEHAANLLAQIQNAVDAIERYRGKLAAASREDSFVLQLQISSLQVKGTGYVHELADVLHVMEQQSPQQELRSRVESAYVGITPMLWEQIEHLRGEIDEARALRASTALDKRSALEDRISKLSRRLDTVYEICMTHMNKMEKLGIDNSETLELLSGSLMERADELSGRMELAQQRITDLKARHKETPDDANIPVLLIASQKDLDNNINSMRVVLDLMDILKLPTDTYRAELVTVTSDIAAGLLDTGVAVSLMSRAVNRAKEWLKADGLRLGIKLLLIMIILAVFHLVARLARKALKRSLSSSKVNISRLLSRMVISTVSNLIMLFGVLVALSQLGISLAPLLAGLGVAGFIVGFALQDSLSNFASGLMILFYRPYDVGDMVDIGGVFGKVHKMSLVSTTILTIDNQKLVVPNKKIWGDVIKNVTAQDVRRVDLVFGISYSDEIPKAEAVLEDILKQHDKVLDDPEPVVRLHNLGDSSVDFVVRPWVRKEDYWDVYWDVTRAVKMRFDEEGIAIPFPQRDVHIYEEKLIGKSETENKGG